MCTNTEVLLCCDDFDLEILSFFRKGKINFICQIKILLFQGNYLSIFLGLCFKWSLLKLL